MKIFLNNLEDLCKIITKVELLGLEKKENKNANMLKGDDDGPFEYILADERVLSKLLSDIRNEKSDKENIDIFKLTEDDIAVGLSNLFGLKISTDEPKVDSKIKEDFDLKNVDIAKGLGNLFGINIACMSDDNIEKKSTIYDTISDIVNNIATQLTAEHNVELSTEAVDKSKDIIHKNIEGIVTRGLVYNFATDFKEDNMNIGISKAAELNEFVKNTEKEAINEAKDVIRYQRTECGNFIKYFPNLDIYVMAATQELLDCAFDNAPANLLDSFNVDMVAKSAIKGKVLMRSGYYNLFEITEDKPTHVLVTLTTSGEYNKYQYESLYKALPSETIIAEVTNKQDEVYSATVAIPLEFRLCLHATGIEIKEE